MSDAGDVVDGFVVESGERLDQLDRDLAVLTRDPRDPDCVTRIFRGIHSIKGVAGFLGFTRLEDLTHAGEHLLVRLRDGVEPVTPRRTGLLLELVDAVRHSIATISTTGQESTADMADLVAELVRPADDPDDRPPGNMGQELIARGLATQAQVASASARQLAGDPRRIGEILVEEAAVPRHAIAEVLRCQARRSTGDGTLRVDAARLDRVTALAQELAAGMAALSTTAADPALRRGLEQLAGLADEVQLAVAATRTQPVGNACGHLRAIVDDLALAGGKQVRLEFHGLAAEIDGRIVDALRDPLMHATRNAVDHGIETPDVRRRAGKPATGRLDIRVSTEAEGIVIEISDDGAGIDPARVIAKAVAKGVIDAEQAAGLSQRQALSLVFAPGVTTAEAVTHVSGRGIGMDVVRANVRRLGGTVELASDAGRGTTLRLRFAGPGPGIRPSAPALTPESVSAGTAAGLPVPGARQAVPRSARQTPEHQR